uniref:Putative ovule protein n=1 Tax=Solanum chacoense TaxID=4108 RepID=A0A0V0IPW0_SOLCH
MSALFDSKAYCYLDMVTCIRCLLILFFSFFYMNTLSVESNWTPHLFDIHLFESTSFKPTEMEAIFIGFEPERQQQKAENEWQKWAKSPSFVFVL